MKAISIFCGANFQGDPDIASAIEQLAELMVFKDIHLVYGGGRVGLMGLMADAVLRRGGRVTGVIPRFLMDKEVGHAGLTELIITENMHERKKHMADLSEGVITLPGGFGTLEEFFEVLTWLQLGLHRHPIGILNLKGFYDPLLQQMDVMLAHGFLKPINRRLVLAHADPASLLEMMEKFDPQPDEVWFRERNLT